MQFVANTRFGFAINCCLIGKSKLKRGDKEDMKKIMDRCGFCGRNDVKLLLCGGCKAVKYCSVECQGGDRKEHKVYCKNLHTRPKTSYTFIRSMVCYGLDGASTIRSMLMFMKPTVMFLVEDMKTHYRVTPSETKFEEAVKKFGKKWGKSIESRMENSIHFFWKSGKMLVVNKKLLSLEWGPVFNNGQV